MPRLVLVEPAYASTVGHHGEVNRPLLAALAEAGWLAHSLLPFQLLGLARHLNQAPPLVLLHWGDQKEGKGRAEALAVLESLLPAALPAALAGWGWLFHQHSSTALPEAERTLLAYAPDRYAERSSGMLWQWAAGRAALGLPAAGVGYGEGWLAAEAAALGLTWHCSQREPWLSALAAAAAALPASASLSPYGRQVLTEPFAAWATRLVSAASGKGPHQG